MKTTVFKLTNGDVTPEIRDSPTWKPYPEYGGQPLDRVSLVQFLSVDGAEIQLVEIAAGGHFVMHSSPDVAFCQIVRGRGKLRLPDNQDLTYQGPELYVFLPDTLHEWHDIAEDTLLSVCLIKQWETST